MRSLAALLLLALTVPAAAHADGSVGVNVDKNDVISISGDGANNEVEVRYNPDNQTIVIEGKNGTLIRGEATPLEIPVGEGADQIKGITFSPGEGNDKTTIDLAGLPEDKRLEEVEVDDTKQTDTGNDEVTVKNVSLTGRSRLKVGQSPGQGDDTTLIEGCDAVNLNASGGVGDSVTVRQCNASKRLKIDRSPTSLVIEDSFYMDLQIKDMDVPDTVQPSRSTRVERTTGKKVSFSGSGADNEVVFVDNEVESVSAKLGGGDDLISFTGSTIEKVSVDGGPGELDCFDESEDGNVIGSIRLKGFEPCDLVLEYFAFGADPEDDPPPDAVAWRTNNPEIGHTDGPYALPGVANPLGLPVRDPLVDVAPAHWADVDQCDWIHLHDAFAGHGDPAPGPPDTESACGHGALEYARPDEDL
jgi:hypothetical protein